MRKYNDCHAYGAMHYGDREYISNVVKRQFSKLKEEEQIVDKKDLTILLTNIKQEMEKLELRMIIKLGAIIVSLVSILKTLELIK